MNGDWTGGRITSFEVPTSSSKLPFVDAFLADLALLFFFLLGVLSGAPLEGGLLANGEVGLGLPSRLVDEVARTRIGFTITDCDLPLMMDEALEDEGLLLSEKNYGKFLKIE